MLAKDIEMFLEHCELKGLSPTIEGEPRQFWNPNTGKFVADKMRLDKRQRIG